MAISTFCRYEKKFLIEKSKYEKILPEILLHMLPDKYCTDGKKYMISNIYYDTQDNSIIRHSLSKPSYKEKLRVRHYGIAQNSSSKVFVEIKKKIRGIVTKRRVAMTLAQADDFIIKGIRPDKIKYLDNQILNEIEYYLKNNPSSPKVYISYDRIAYFDKADKDIRLTFDDNITVRRYDLDLRHAPYGEKLLSPEYYLMELKIKNAVPLWLSQLLSREKIYMMSFSKYGTEYKNYVTSQHQSNEFDKIAN